MLPIEWQIRQMVLRLWLETADTQLGAVVDKDSRINTVCCSISGIQGTLDGGVGNQFALGNKLMTLFLYWSRRCWRSSSNSF